MDIEALALWQRGGDRNSTKPKPIPRPGGTLRKGRSLSAGDIARLRDLAARRRAARKDPHGRD